MRRIVIAVCLLALLAPAVSAGRKKDKAGSVSDRVYQDKKYSFQLKLSDGWKYKVRKNKDAFRLVLTQNNFEIPPYYLDAPDYTQIPRTVVYVGETNMSVDMFIDSLVNEDYRSDQKKELMKEFDILNDQSAGSGMTREKLVTRKKKRMQLGDLKGMFWTGQVKYRNEVSESSSSISAGKRVYGAFGGLIVAIKKDNNIIVFHTVCEWTYFENIRDEVMAIINSLEWGKS